MDKYRIRANYKEIEQLKDRANRFAIFGAGAYGKTWGYEILKLLGINISAYYDNYVKPGTEVRDGIRVGNLEELYQYRERNHLVFFLTVAYNNQKDIIEQLHAKNIRNIYIIDALFMQYMIEDITTSGSEEEKKRFETIINDELFLKNAYLHRIGRKLDLDNPIRLNDKIHWLKLNDRKTIYSIWADKLAVREYIKESFGEEYLVPLLFKTDNLAELTLNSIPNEPCIIKTNRGCGDYTIIRDKKEVSIEELRDKYRYYLALNIYYLGREYQYKNIIPSIIIEKLLLDENGKIPNDYKLHFINGKCEFIYCSIDREGKNYRKVYDIKWNPMEFSWTSSTLNNWGEDIPKPVNFNRMIEIGSEIAKIVPYVRVDFYDVNGKLYCGEITLHHASGFDLFYPDRYDEFFGEKIKIKNDY